MAKTHAESPLLPNVGGFTRESCQSSQAEDEEPRLQKIRSAISELPNDGNNTVSSLPRQEPSVPIEQQKKPPSRLKNHLKYYWWKVLSRIPSETARASAVRQQIIWAKEIDDLHSREEPLLPQGILNITEKSRSIIDNIIKQKTPEGVDFSKEQVALSTVVKEDGEQRLVVAVERIPEPKSPCYIAYEILEDKITGDAVVLSHGMIDTDITDESGVSPEIRTSCSWRQKRFFPTNTPELQP